MNTKRVRQLAALVAVAAGTGKAWQATEDRGHENHPVETGPGALKGSA